MQIPDVTNSYKICPLICLFYTNSTSKLFITLNELSCLPPDLTKLIIELFTFYMVITLKVKVDNGPMVKSFLLGRTLVIRLFLLSFNIKVLLKKAMSFLICCKCHTCVNMLSTATLSFTHKCLRLSNEYLPPVYLDRFKRPLPPACSCSRRICFYFGWVKSLLSDFWAQNVHGKTFMSSSLNVVALRFSLICSVPLRRRPPREHRGQRRPGQLEKLHLLLQASQSCLSTFCCGALRGPPHSPTHPPTQSDHE